MMFVTITPSLPAGPPVQAPVTLLTCSTAVVDQLAGGAHEVCRSTAGLALGLRLQAGRRQEGESHVSRPPVQRLRPGSHQEVPSLGVRTVERERCCWSCLPSRLLGTSLEHRWHLLEISRRSNPRLVLYILLHGPGEVDRLVDLLGVVTHVVHHRRMMRLVSVGLISSAVHGIVIFSVLPFAQSRDLGGRWFEHLAVQRGPEK